MEDVLCNGQLVTYYEGKKRDDTGLRFKHKKGGIYYCPKCGLKACYSESSDDIYEKIEALSRKGKGKEKRVAKKYIKSLKRGK